MHERRFDGKVVVVTGGSSGIGRAVSRRLAAEGARVVLLARREDALNESIGMLEGTGHAAHAVDCADEAAMTKVATQLKQAGTTVDALVMAAGAHLLRPLLLSTAKHLAQQYEANVVTTHVTARAFTPLMNRSGSSMTAVSSVASLRSAPGAGAYGAAKASLNALVQTMAVELASRKIRVNGIVAGVVKTQMSDELMAGMTDAQREALAAAHPLGIGTVDDVTGPIAFLASGDARWMTGSLLVVDGGLSTR